MFEINETIFEQNMLGTNNTNKNFINLKFISVIRDVKIDENGFMI